MFDSRRAVHDLVAAKALAYGAHGWHAAQRPDSSWLGDQQRRDQAESAQSEKQIQ